MEQCRRVIAETQSTESDCKSTASPSVRRGHIGEFMANCCGLSTKAPLLPVGGGAGGAVKSLNLRARLADLREQARVEELALHHGAQDDHKLLKDRVGGWALTPDQLRYLKCTPYEYNASAGSYLELLFLQR